ncbi:hypothetical protein TNCT_344781 [Trichonephila clavata]|uniref:Uncharacterized protein n=1 Tax=Trichonephila clavata TaxID=2740835 RepID=A0A8X6IZ56_TRICU|nr:hypothetical protein TNCT_344781 [Trichonephila clavata]
MASDSDMDVPTNEMQRTQTPPIEPPQFNQMDFTMTQIRRMEQIKQENALKIVQCSSKRKDFGDFGYPPLSKTKSRFLFDIPKNSPIFISQNRFSFQVNSHKKPGANITNVSPAIVQKTPPTQTNPSANHMYRVSEPSPTSPLLILKKKLQQPI